MGTDVAPRKEFLIAGAAELDRSRIERLSDENSHANRDGGAVVRRQRRPRLAGVNTTLPPSPPDRPPPRRPPFSSPACSGACAGTDGGAVEPMVSATLGQQSGAEASPSAEASLSTDASGEGAESLSYGGRTGATALELLLEADPSAEVTGEGENAFVTAIGGRAADESKSEFWSLAVDGELGQVGAGALETEDGQEITWTSRRTDAVVGRARRAGPRVPTARDLARCDLTSRELAHRWWRPATVVLVLAAAVVWRLVAPGLGAPPNLEIATAATFLAVLLLRNRWAAVVPFAVVAVSDAVLGNTQIMWFTWSAWAVLGVGAILARHLRGTRRYAAALGVGVVGSLWFFAWTNFGVWLLDGMYPSTLDGLLASYVAGLPFLRTMLLGNLVLVPFAAVVAGLVERAETARDARRPRQGLPRQPVQEPAPTSAGCARPVDRPTVGPETGRSDFCPDAVARAIAVRVSSDPLAGPGAQCRASGTSPRRSDAARQPSPRLATV